MRVALYDLGVGHLTDMEFLGIGMNRGVWTFPSCFADCMAD